MTSWYSKVTSQIKQVFASEADGDGDTEDDTHVCRVLREYYTERGRPFPTWLPPDPKAPQPVPSASAPPAIGSLFGNMNNNTTTNNHGNALASTSSLSSLWSNAKDDRQSHPPIATASLRRGGRGMDFGDTPSDQTASAGAGRMPQDRFRQLYGRRTISPANNTAFDPPRTAGGNGRDNGGGSLDY